MRHLKLGLVVIAGIVITIVGALAVIAAMMMNESSENEPIGV